MKITGIIAEYNPFHRGHAYHLQKAREITGADYIVVCMSGSYVQRGEPALLDRYTRTAMALRGGADLVLELPVPFSCAAAPDFASRGVRILSGAGCDCLCWGSEELPNEALVSDILDILTDEPQNYRRLLQDSLRSGLSFPAAREKAVAELIGEPMVHRILSSPNQLLGLEYRLAIRRFAPEMTGCPLLRAGNGHGDSRLYTDSADGFSSAGSIRRALQQSAPSDDLARLLGGSMFPEDIRLLACEPRLFPDDFSLLLQMRRLSLRPSSAPDDLMRRLLSLPADYLRWSLLIEALKSRQFTYTRVSRLLCAVLLGLRTEEIDAWRQDPATLYGRILGFRKESAPLLHELKKRSAVPLLSKPADAESILPADALDLYRKNVYAEHIYQTVRAANGCIFRNDRRQGPVIL